MCTIKRKIGKYRKDVEKNIQQAHIAQTHKGILLKEKKPCHNRFLRGIATRQKGDRDLKMPTKTALIAAAAPNLKMRGQFEL